MAVLGIMPPGPTCSEGACDKGPFSASRCESRELHELRAIEDIQLEALRLRARLEAELEALSLSDLGGTQWAAEAPVASSKFSSRIPTPQSGPAHRGLLRTDRDRADRSTSAGRRRGAQFGLASPSVTDVDTQSSASEQKTVPLRSPRRPADSLLSRARGGPGASGPVYAAKFKAEARRSDTPTPRPKMQQSRRSLGSSGSSSGPLLTPRTRSTQPADSPVSRASSTRRAARGATVPAGSASKAAGQHRTRSAQRLRASLAGLATLALSASSASLPATPRLQPATEQERAPSAQRQRCVGASGSGTSSGKALSGAPRRAGSAQSHRASLSTLSSCASPVSAGPQSSLPTTPRLPTSGAGSDGGAGRLQRSAVPAAPVIASPKVTGPTSPRPKATPWLGDAQATGQRRPLLRGSGTMSVPTAPQADRRVAPCAGTSGAPVTPRGGTRTVPAPSVARFCVRPISPLTSPRSQGSVARCPGGHELQAFATPTEDHSCAACDKTVGRGATLWACRPCGYEVCRNCWQHAASACFTFSSPQRLPQHSRPGGV